MSEGCYLIQVQLLVEIQDHELCLYQDTGPQTLQYQSQELDLDQDTRPQNRRYSAEALDPTDPEPRESVDISFYKEFKYNF